MADDSAQDGPWRRAIRRRTALMVACLVGSWALVAMIWMTLRRVLTLV